MQAEMAVGAKLETIHVRAVNSASGSKGSIHDDVKAREMGYAGGFVPGVTVLGYMTRLMQVTFGQDWLQCAQFDGRLRRPLYAGVDATVEGTIVAKPSAANGGRYQVELHVLDPDGVVVALASASCRVGTDD